MDSFHAKIGWKRMRKSENKNYRSVPFRSYPTRNRNFQKSSKKIPKTKKHRYGFISRQNRLENDEMESNYKLMFRSVPTRREIENSKTTTKNSKN